VSTAKPCVSDHYLTWSWIVAGLFVATANVADTIPAALFTGWK